MYGFPCGKLEPEFKGKLGSSPFDTSVVIPALLAGLYVAKRAKTLCSRIGSGRVRLGLISPYVGMRETALRLWECMKSEEFAFAELFFVTIDSIQGENYDVCVLLLPLYFSPFAFDLRRVITMISRSRVSLVMPLGLPPGRREMPVCGACALHDFVEDAQTEKLTIGELESVLPSRGGKSVELQTWWPDMADRMNERASKKKDMEVARSRERAARRLEAASCVLFRGARLHFLDSIDYWQRSLGLHPPSGCFVELGVRFFFFMCCMLYWGVCARD